MTKENSEKELAAPAQEQKEASELKQEAYLLTMGPLPKSAYTCQLEELTKKILANIPFTITQKSDSYQIKFAGDFLPYNLTNIFKYANLQHLMFNKDDFDAYEKYLATDAVRKSELTGNLNALKQLYPDLHPAEMHAINIYTGHYYTEMNALLRGRYKFKMDKPSATRDVILHTVFCGSALARISDSSIPASYRKEAIFDKKIHQDRIDAATRKGVTELSGFVSTSTSNSKLKTGVKFSFTNLRGKYIAPLSRHPDEQEFLIPPTQIQITKYGEASGLHSFEAAPVSDLASLKPEQMFTLAELREQELKNIPQELEDYLKHQIERMTPESLVPNFKCETFERKLSAFREQLEDVIKVKSDISEGRLVERPDIVERIDLILRKIEDTISDKTMSAIELTNMKEMIKQIRKGMDCEDASNFLGHDTTKPK